MSEESVVGRKLYLLCKKWSEWSSRVWVGFSSPTVEEIAQFIEGLEKDFYVKCNDRYDFREIAEGYENLPTEPRTISYDIWVLEGEEDFKTVKRHIARIDFHYVQNFPDIRAIVVHGRTKSERDC